MGTIAKQPVVNAWHVALSKVHKVGAEERGMLSWHIGQHVGSDPPPSGQHLRIQCPA